MKIKVAELTGAKLDYWVAKALGWKQAAYGDRVVWVQANGEGRFRCNFNDWNPSTSWADGGPIIEREEITWHWQHTIKGKFAVPPNFYDGKDESVLVAAMRCFVAIKFGEEVEG